MKRQSFFCLLVVLMFSCGGRKTPTMERTPVIPGTHSFSVSERASAHRYPKLANQIQVCCGNARLNPLFDGLHYYDLIVVEADTIHTVAQYLGPDGILRMRNPSLIVLVYFSGGDVNPYYLQPVQQNFVDSMKDSWYLHDIHGNQVPFYYLPSSRWTLAQNPSTAVNEFLPQYLNRNVLQTGLVDGIFYDWATTHVSWINHRKHSESGPIDIDNDGKPDSDPKIDEVWTNGYLKMLKNSRIYFPHGTLVLGNGGWNTGPGYSTALNGIMIEQFTGGEKSNPDLYGWRALMRTYSYYLEKSVFPRVSLIMANDDSPDNYKLMRFALCSALMFDGYFCFTNTNKIGPYSQNRWYDEYSVDLNSGESGKNFKDKGYLGIARTKAYDVSDPKEFLEDAARYSGNKSETRVWRRDFENGIVLVNPTREEKNIELKGTYRKIKGIVDPDFNNGASLNSIQLGSQEGVILLNQSLLDEQEKSP